MSAYAIPRPKARNPWQEVISWVFGVATVVTTKGKAKIAEQNTVGSAGKYAAGGTAEPPKFLAMGVGAHTAERKAEATDTALSNEKETRTEGTMSNVTITNTNDTFQVTGSQTATAARAVDEAALFDKSSGGNMFTSATIETDNLNEGDSITWTWKVKQA